MAQKSNKQPHKKPAKKIAAEHKNIHPAARPFLWLGEEKTVKNFIFVPLVGVIVFSILGYFFPLHHPAKWDFFASYSVIGFVAYSFVVLAAWPLFKLLSRPENYYGEDDDV
jgi:hypothetical protein